MKRLVIVLAIASLAACGDVGPLRPVAGQPLPVKPKLASKTPTPDELLASLPHAHPERVDELMKKSEPRQPDRFDLPPPDGTALPDPAPGTSDPATGEEDSTRVQEPR
jgi:predicted small lipoprotein YifL